MSVHQNSTTIETVFKNSVRLEDDDVANLSLVEQEQKLLSTLLRECLIYKWDAAFDHDPLDSYIFHSEKWSAKNGIFDLGEYLQNVSRLFSSQLKEHNTFDTREMSILANTVQLALFYQFKLQFKDSASSNLSFCGNLIAPISNPFDFHQFVEAAFKRFCSFI